MRNLKLSTIGKACIVERDAEFLQEVQSAGLEGKSLVMFKSPEDAMQRLLEDNAKLRAHERLLDQIFNDENVARRLRSIVEWLQDDSRHQIIDIVFCAFSLPIMNGARLLGEIRPSRMRRVLLASDEERGDAIKALNAGAVDAYVDKGGPDPMGEMAMQISRGPRVAYEMLWRGLDYDLGQMLFLPGVHSAISKVMDEHGVVEHVLVPSPWGFIARTNEEGYLWMQLETHESQIGAVEILRDEGWLQDALEDFIAGDKAACIEARSLQGFSDASPEFPTTTMINMSLDPWLGLSIFQVVI